MKRFASTLLVSDLVVFAVAAPCVGRTVVATPSIFRKILLSKFILYIDIFRFSETIEKLKEIHILIFMTFI